MRVLFLFCCSFACFWSCAQDAGTVAPSRFDSIHICHIDGQLRKVATAGFYLSMSDGRLTQLGTTDSSFIYYGGSDEFEVHNESGAYMFLKLTKKGVAVRTRDTSFLLNQYSKISPLSNLPRYRSGDTTIRVGSFAVRLGFIDRHIDKIEITMETYAITVHLSRHHRVTNRGAFEWIVNCQNLFSHSYISTYVARKYRSAAVMNATDSVGVSLSFDKRNVFHGLYGTRIIPELPLLYDDAHYAVRYGNHGEVLEHRGFRIGCY